MFDFRDINSLLVAISEPVYWYRPAWSLRIVSGREVNAGQPLLIELSPQHLRPLKLGHLPKPVEQKRQELTIRCL